MSSFGEKIVSKLDKFIPDGEKESFKILSVKCLKEGGPSGLQKLKSEICSLAQCPSEDVVKEIEEIYNDHTINTLSFVYHNKQAAAIAGVLTKMADKIYLDVAVPTEEKSLVLESTRKILHRLQSCEPTQIPEDMKTEILEHNEVLKLLATEFESIKDPTFDLSETVKELTTTSPE